MSAAEMKGECTIMLGNVQYYSNLNKKNVRKSKMPLQAKTTTKNNKNNKNLFLKREWLFLLTFLSQYN